MYQIILTLRLSKQYPLNPLMPIAVIKSGTQAYNIATSNSHLFHHRLIFLRDIKHLLKMTKDSIKPGVVWDSARQERKARQTMYHEITGIFL